MGLVGSLTMRRRTDIFVLLAIFVMIEKFLGESLGLGQVMTLQSVLSQFQLLMVLDAWVGSVIMTNALLTSN